MRRPAGDYDGPMGSPDERLRAILDEHIATVERTRDGLLGEVAALADDLVAALERGGKLVAFGNGGSAADAQHFAAELVGRFSRPRGAARGAGAHDGQLDPDRDRERLRLCRGLRAPGPGARPRRGPRRRDQHVWARRRASSAARRRRGRSAPGRGASPAPSGGRLAAVVDRCLRVPSTVTARVQEVHVTVIHAVSELVDERFAGDAQRRATGPRRAGSGVRRGSTADRPELRPVRRPAASPRPCTRRPPGCRSRRSASRRPCGLDA